MSTLERTLTARALAVAVHAGQRYGDFPYEYHLEKCQAVRRRFVTEDMLSWVGMTAEEVEIAVWFHDSVEDTPRMTLAMLSALYGETVADAVGAVTDAPGKNRQAKKWGTPEDPGPMIKLRGSRPGLLVKLLDRIANVEASRAADEKLPRHKSRIPMYRDEQAEFRALRREGPLGPLWDHLEQILQTAPGPGAYAGGPYAP